MAEVTVSTRYRIVIPKAVRETLGVEIGQKLQAFAGPRQIILVPVEPLPVMRGFLSRLENDFDRALDEG
jgi:AbrB family looped-hinge helix DNA binding protein